ncbi:response regulator [Methanoregula sp.]|uniref:response regulator n=1 Tax=Methanoregula sp. TaxID=2052170 RepID=UPI003BB188C1
MTHPPRILIVDDDPIITRLLATMLQKKRFNVVGTVTSGEEAIIKSAELNPDLVMMNTNLSGALDGIDAAYYIFQLFHCPILFITEIPDEKRLERVKYAEPYGIIFKPFTEIEITTNVDLAIYNHGNRPNSPEQYPVGDPKKIMDVLDGIFIMDKRGRIIFFNTYATWLLDIPAGQIMMKHWREVLMLINATTHEEIKDPVSDAINHLAGVFYDTYTAMVTTTSKCRQVKVAVRPILDTHGKLLAAIMSIKEKSP